MFIAEDSILISLDLEAILSAMGSEVVGVGTNVAQALPFANPDKIDLAIIDYLLDGGTCERLIDALVAQSIPFVICTGFAPEEIEASYRGVPILRKPFDADVDLLNDFSEACRREFELLRVRLFSMSGG